MPRERIVAPWVIARLLGAGGGALAFGLPALLMLAGGDYAFGAIGLVGAAIFGLIARGATSDIVYLQPGRVTIRGVEYQGREDLQALSVVPWELEFKGRVGRRHGCCVVLIDRNGKILETPLGSSNKTSAEGWCRQLARSMEVPIQDVSDKVVRELAWP
jgi:hypothetical protein